MMPLPPPDIISDVPAADMQVNVQSMLFGQMGYTVGGAGALSEGA